MSDEIPPENNEQPPPQDDGRMGSYSDMQDEGNSNNEPVPQDHGRYQDDQERYDGETQESHDQGGQEVIGSAHIRPIFLGNLDMGATTEDISNLFTRPVLNFPAMPVERVDLKRGYAFVFLCDARSQEEKGRVEQYVDGIQGMDFRRVSPALRAEFARGDGRIKRKEDDRRINIQPNETLFVVNFSEETTKKEDLEMLFSKFGDLVRIDMKRNYAFVQFTSIEDATKAKNATNGGKLDQNVITVEYVAQKRGNDDRRRGDRDRRGGRGDYRGRRGYDRDRDYDRDYDRRRSPPRGRRYGRSRSRSPAQNRYRSRSRSPPARRYREDYKPRGRYEEQGEASPREGVRDRETRGYR